MRLEPEDELVHAPDAAQNFNESVYVNALESDGTVGGWMRLGNRVNEGYAELSMVFYLPGGRVACQFGRPRIEVNDAFDAGGLRYEVVEPFETVRMTYDGELLVLDDPAALRDPRTMFETAPRLPGSVEFVTQRVSPPHGGEPTSPEEEAEMLYGSEFSRGHFNQHHRASGHIEVGDERFELADAFGWRDHSWGPRWWQAIWSYRLFLGNLGADRGLMLLKNLREDGPSKRMGVLLVDGDYEEVIDLDVVSDWDDALDPTGATIVARTAHRTAVISAEVVSMAPLRNRRSEGGVELRSRVAEGFTRFRWDDRVGFGMSEYIERVEGGQPVGYPA